jgi:uncharacterized repeat protein (TIGR04138 family)
MQALRFDAAVDHILEREKRFERGAYFLLKDALDFTLKRSREESGEERHVSGEELIFGFRDFALQEFGPMSKTLLREWGVHTCADVGDMVFELIEEGMFGKQDSDTQEDFCDHYDFDEAFLNPFLPECGPVKAEENQDGDSDPPADEETPFSHAPQDAS